VSSFLEHLLFGKTLKCLKLESNPMQIMFIFKLKLSFVLRVKNYVAHDSEGGIMILT
jgi:hypothetical protein